LADRLVDGDGAIRLADFLRFHHSPPESAKNSACQTPSIAADAPARLLRMRPERRIAMPINVYHESDTLPSSAATVPFPFAAPPDIPPRNRRLNRALSMICPEMDTPPACQVRVGAFRNGRARWRREGADNFAGDRLPAHRRLPLAACYAWRTMAGHALALCLDGRRSPLAHRAHRTSGSYPAPTPDAPPYVRWACSIFGLGVAAGIIMLLVRFTSDHAWWTGHLRGGGF
jgi:hypothetical protein